jgi:hypothetical protein
LLKQVLRYYPGNIGWIKLRGDLEFANSNNEAAMKYYVSSMVSWKWRKSRLMVFVRTMRRTFL